MVRLEASILKRFPQYLVPIIIIWSNWAMLVTARPPLLLILIRVLDGPAAIPLVIIPLSIAIIIENWRLVPKFWLPLTIIMAIFGAEVVVSGIITWWAIAVVRIVACSSGRALIVAPGSPSSATLPIFSTPSTTTVSAMASALIAIVTGLIAAAAATPGLNVIVVIRSTVVVAIVLRVLKIAVLTATSVA